MAYSISSNRGLTGFPQGYVSAWQNYQPYAPSYGGKTANENAAENMAYAQSRRGGGGDIMSQIQQLFAPMQGGSQGPTQRTSSTRSGRGNAAGRWSQGWQPGAYGDSSGVGGTTGMGGLLSSFMGNSGIPPATTNPQVPVTGGNVAQVSSGITSGRLPDASIQQALATLMGGATQAPGALGDMLRMNTNRNAIDLQRAGAEQQADMQHAYEVANAQGFLQNAQLASDTNRENVTHGVNMRNSVLNLIGLLMGGLA